MSNVGSSRQDTTRAEFGTTESESATAFRSTGPVKRIRIAHSAELAQIVVEAIVGFPVVRFVVSSRGKPTIAKPTSTISTAAAITLDGLSSNRGPRDRAGREVPDRGGSRSPGRQRMMM